MLMYFDQKTSREEDRLRVIGVSGRIILKCILDKYGIKVWTGFGWSNTRSVASFCEHCDETFGSIKTGSLLTSCVTVGFARNTHITACIVLTN